MKFKIKGEILLDVAKSVESVYQDEMVMKFADDRWVVKSEGPSNAIMTAARVTDDDMEQYDKGDTDELGIDCGTLKSFISDGDSDIMFHYDEVDNKLYLKEGTTEMVTGTILPEQVSGNKTRFPDIDYPAKIDGEISFLSTFYSKATSTVNTDHIVVGCRKNRLYLYAPADTGHIKDNEDWDSFESHEVDFDNEHAMDGYADSMFSTEILDSMYKPSDEGIIEMGHDIPMRFLFKTDTGVPITYFIAPRIEEEMGDDEKIPSSYVEDEDKP